jgi:DNA-binding NtrC family response regulator
MRSELLLIEHSGTSLRDYIDDMVSDVFQPGWGIAAWDAQLSERLKQCKAQLVIVVAVPLPPQAVDLFKWLREHHTQTPVLAVLPGDVDEATLGAISKEADDFILWPINKEELRHRVRRALGPGNQKSELQSARSLLTESVGMAQLVGNHPTFIRAIEPIPLFAGSNLPVLITGATGTGKELCARAIHLMSNRRSLPFIAADCGAIPDHLFENELFGHMRGAFTDAHTDQKGLAALAEGGVLFLDEIDALSPVAQTKLLRFLQEAVYRPLGGERFIKANVHVITASNQHIEALVQEKLFRADLYFRLNVLRLQLPTLLERHSDIEFLSRHFLRMSTAHISPRKSFSQAALHKLNSYTWPGNVRELYNVVARAALVAEGRHILPGHILLPVSDDDDDSAATNSFNRARSQAIETFERRYVKDLLCKHSGNVTHAALEAGKDRRAFGRLKKKYGITV